MALFRSPKFEELEETFLRGRTFDEGDMAFTLTLFKIMPYPTEILQYRWMVRLADGYEFEAYMGEELCSLPYTRLKDIQEKIAAHSSALNSEQMANEIDGTIQAIFDEYK